MGVPGHRPAEPDFNVVWVRTKDEQIYRRDRNGVSHRLSFVLDLENRCPSVISNLNPEA
jgi:hypothetical protein